MLRKIWVCSAIATLSSSLLAGSYSGGTGTYASPYQIATKQDLLELANTPADYNKFFVQRANIDLWGQTYETALIAPDTDSSTDAFEGDAFTGQYDGAGYSIRNLTISASGDDSYIGLFGQISGAGARVQNLVLESISIEGGDGSDRIGAVCGSSDGAAIYGCRVTGSLSGGDASTGGICGVNYGSIVDCSVNAAITAGRIYTGGVCGYNSGEILYSYSIGSVAADSSSSRVGGLCGHNVVDSTISECYSESSVSGANASSGGLCGVNDGEISDSYAQGSVSSGNYYSGGFCGFNNSDGSIRRCYSAGAVSGTAYIGGLCGTNKSTNVRNSFWDVDSSGVLSGGNAGTGKTTAQMQSQSTFTSAGWNFASIWYMNGYPALRSAGAEPEKDTVLLQLEGPDELNELSTGSYVSTAYFSDETFEDVTLDTVWSTDTPQYVTIEDGALTVGEVPSNVLVTVIAEYDGLIASQQVAIVNIPLPEPPYDESFEDGFGIWVPSPGLDFEWYRHNDYTPSPSTGPDGATDGEWYIYAEATGNSPAKSAGIEAEFDFYQSDSPLLEFEYHMYGGTMGSLHVDIFDGTTWYLSEWSVSGQQQTSESDSWGVAGVDLAAFAGLPYVMIRLRAVTGDNFLSDIAVDNIILSNDGEGGPYSGGAGTVANPYRIANKVDLLELSANDYDYDKHFRVIADIDMGWEVFNQSIIAPDGDLVAFTGSMDGGDYTISNLYLDADEFLFYEFGLFGYISGAELKNINLAGVIITNVLDSSNIGTLCGFSVGSTISNCSVVAGEIHTSAAASVGGLIGAVAGHFYADDDNGFLTNVISECSSSVRILADDSSKVGGFIGHCGGKVNSCSASVELYASNLSSEIGGFVGKIGGYGTVTDCSAEGTINLVSSEVAGGFCGDNRAVIDYCRSQCNIFCVGTRFNEIGGFCAINDTGASISKSYALGFVMINGQGSNIGGLCGFNSGDVFACYASGSVTVSGLLDAGGGLCGLSDGVIDSCFAVGSVSGGNDSEGLGGLCGFNYGIIRECYSVGSVSGAENSSNLGGFCGNNTDLVETSFWDIQRSGITTSAGGVGTNTVDMQTQSMFTAAGWDFVNLWTMDGYPVFSDIPFVSVVPLQGLPYGESFEVDFDIWQHSDINEFNFIRKSGQTPSANTGPSQASDGSWYIYAEATDNYYKTAAVEAEFTFFTVVAPVLTFDYHMYGGTMGSLHVDIFDGSVWHNSIWSRDGAQQGSMADPWSVANVDLGLYASLPGVVIRIRAVIGPGFLSDIAVDNIELTETYDGTLSFLAWVTQEGIPAGQQGESDTPAGDSIPNLLKYACGLPAMQSYSTPDYMTIATNLPSGQFGIIYYQSKSARDIVLQPIWTYALNANWTALGLDITKTGEDADREVWQAVLTGGDTGFMKLRVTPIDN